jgi:hypothetical protein
MSSGTLTDAQFEDRSWHDNHVHSLRIVEGQHGAGELIRDITYIVEWLQVPAGFRFRIEPSWLSFQGVTDLRVGLDYAGMSAALVSLSIHAVDRRSLQRERKLAQVWTSALDFPGGEISFEAAGYKQVAWGNRLCLSSNAYEQLSVSMLNPAQRGMGSFLEGSHRPRAASGPPPDVADHDPSMNIAAPGRAARSGCSRPNARDHFQVFERRSGGGAACQATADRFNSSARQESSGQRETAACGFAPA